MKLKSDIVCELEENLRLYRSKLGYDCIFDKHEYVLRELNNFLEMQELITTLDPDCLSEHHREQLIEFKGSTEVQGKDVIHADYMKKLIHHKSVNKHSSPMLASAKYQKYQTSQKEKYAKLEKMIKSFLEAKDDFPVK